MKKAGITHQLAKLYQAEQSLLFKFAIDTECSDEQINYICRKIFELSNLILRLENTLWSIKNEK